MSVCFRFKAAPLLKRGGREIYDGSFSGKLVHGLGVTAELLLKNGVEVFGESETEKLF